MNIQDTLTKTAESFRLQALSLAADAEAIRKDRDDLWLLVQMMRTALQLGEGTPEYMDKAIALQLRFMEQRAAAQGWPEDKE
jgi:hypothetical protein